jgi:exopolyphosphatase/pppGpp-phosphohydrolase
LGTTNFAQTTYGGIEIGGKGVKISVINIENLDEGKFKIINFWTVNTAITKNISVDKKLNKTDIAETAIVVQDVLKTLKIDFKLPDDKIFIIASSGVAIAQNKEDLQIKVKELTGRDLDFVTSEQEGKLVTKGAVPPKKYKNSLIIDIGGGNTKGGYVEITDNPYQPYRFAPMAFELGSVTLTERIKKNASSTDFKDYIASSIVFNDSLKYIIKSVYDNKPGCKYKENIYMIGGATWCMSTFMAPQNKDAFWEFTLNDIKQYNSNLINNYDEMVKNPSPELEKVLSTYSRESLIAGSMILLNSVNLLDKPETKKLYFVRQGHIAWLVAYIVDSARKNN